MNNIGWPGWRTVGRLGSGSFGTVYEIERDNNGIIEKAALKVITIPRDESEVNDLRMKQMSEDYITSYYSDYKNHVLREYENMSKLHGCRNVVQCNDFKAIPHDDGIGWDILIKMELLTPLQNRLEGPFDEDDVIELGKDICKALVACSKEGITHRDIKPQNIFLSENGDYKLGDFGVARTLSGTTRSASRGVGTHDYMAPEVKNSEHYSNKADICSLGIVLYMLLNERRLPFEPLPPKLPRADYDYAAHRFRGEELPAPKNGRRSLKKIVLKACAFDPKDRYQSAEEMLHDLTDVGMGRKPSSFLPKHNPDKPNPGYSPPGDKPEDPLHGDDEGVPGDTSQPHGSTGTDDVFRGGKKPGTEGVFDGKDPTGTTTKDPPNHWGRIVLFTLCSIAILAVCFFNIHKWMPATCTEPEKCSICGKTKGDPNGHKWTEATCIAPKTCSVCNLKVGNELGHIWTEATCTKPKECKRCGITEGDTLGHRWTLCKEDSRVCSQCGASKNVTDVNGNYRLVKETYKDNSINYQYDGKGRISRKIETSSYGSKTVTEYSYNQYGNLVETCFTNDLGVSVYFHYDNNGTRIEMENDGMGGDAFSYGGEYQESIDKSYDESGYILNFVRTTLEEGNSNKRAIKYSYDEGGHISCVTVGSERVDFFNYHLDGSLSIARRGLFNFQEEYDKKGNLKSVERSSGFNQDDKSVWYLYTYEYDENDNLSSVTHEYYFGGNKVKKISEYEYDSSGLMIKKNLDGKIFTYDYYFDENGNIIARTECYNNSEQNKVEFEYEKI